MRTEIVPHARREAALSSSRCVYSVSLSTDAHRYRRMLAGFAWTISKFSDVLIFHGDGILLETTLRITGMPFGQAMAEAARVSAATLTDLAQIKPGVDVWMASQAQQDSAFAVVHERVWHAYWTDPVLAGSIDDDARAYISRLTSTQRLQMPAPEAQRLAVAYLVFEIAGYSLLAGRGYLVDVYASGSGELPTLKKFMAGAIANFPELEQRSCIILKTR